MNSSDIKRVLGKKSIIILICAILFIISGVFGIYYGYISLVDINNPVSLNSIINDTKSINEYSYIDATFVSAFATKDNHTYFYVRDVNNYYAIVNLSTDTYFDIYNSAAELKDNFHFVLYGYTNVIPEDIKNKAIENFSSLQLDVDINESTFKNYFGGLYLNELIKPDKEINYVYIGLGSGLLGFGLVFIIIYLISVFKYNMNKEYSKELGASKVKYFYIENIAFANKIFAHNDVFKYSDILKVSTDKKKIYITTKYNKLVIKYNEDIENYMKNNKKIKFSEK